MGERPAPDLFTALSLEPPRAAPPIGRERRRSRVDEPDELDDVDTSPTGLPPAPAAASTPAAASAPAAAPVENPTRVVEPASLALDRAAAAESAARAGIPPSPFGGSVPLPTPMPPPPAPPPAAVATPARSSRAPQRTEVVPAIPPKPSRTRRARPASPAAAPGAPAPESSASSGGMGLADLLEPSDGRAVEGLDDLVAEMSRDLSMSGAAQPIVALDDPKSYPAPGMSGIGMRAPSIPPSPDWDEAPRRKGGIGWIFVPVSLVLAGTLGWVLYTQTDLFSGDVLAKRDAEVAAEVAAEQDAARDAAAAQKKERGTLTLSSEPSKARVWMVADGPEAKFPNLPIDGEYMVAVTAAGHQPRVRVVKGSELVAPVVVDLDPLPPEAAAGPAPEIPAAPVPKVGQDAKRTTELVLRSNTPGASLMLLVGYTPGATVVDLDVGETHRFLVTLAGYEPHAIELKGRHWEETDGGTLVYDDTVTLRPREAGSPSPRGDAEHDAKAE